MKTSSIPNDVSPVLLTDEAEAERLEKMYGGTVQYLTDEDVKMDSMQDFDMGFLDTPEQYR